MLTPKPLIEVNPAQRLKLTKLSLTVRLELVTLMMIVCNTLADAVVIVATWIRTFALVRLHRRRKRSIAWLLLRDGRFSLGLLFVRDQLTIYIHLQGPSTLRVSPLLRTSLLS